MWVLPLGPAGFPPLASYSRHRVNRCLFTYISAQQIFIMKSSMSHAQLHYAILIFLIFLFPVLGSPSRPRCTPAPAPTQVPELLPKSALSEYYAQEPTYNASADILDRLDSEGKILNKLSLYVLAIDGQNWSFFNRIFTEDAITNFETPDPASPIRGRATIQAFIEGALGPFDTHTLTGTRVVRVHEDNPCRASSLFLYTTTLFGRGNLDGRV